MMTNQYDPPVESPPESVLPPPRTAPEGTELVQDATIQGNVLAAFNKDLQTFLLLRFVDGATGRAWLADLIPDIATNAQVAAFNVDFRRKRRAAGTDPEDLFATWTNISLTGAGLRKLAPNDVAALGLLDGVDPGVQVWMDGAAAVTEAVGDTEGSAPEHWLFGADASQVDAIVCVAADRRADFDDRIATLRELSAEHGVVVVFQQDGETLPGRARGHEHFGFKDGISQPGVRGFDAPNPDDPDEVEGKPGTDLIEPGEFVLGYVGQGDGRPGRMVPFWMWDGSFLVFRRLAQNVPGFWTDIQRAAALFDETQTTGDTGIRDAETLGARLVGRWRNGTPTDDSPLSDVPLLGDPGLNDFEFESDPEGVKTPHAAHIRKVYPRKGAESSTAAVTEAAAEQRRILRRGIPFGQPFNPTAGHGNGVDSSRGLVFQCYQASLSDQFIFLQRQWVNDQDFTDAGDGKDAVIGQATTVALHPNNVATKAELHQWVTTEGSIFAFTPSLPTLRALSAGEHLPVEAAHDG
jgi:Dyp-type peroxidase family